MTVRATSLTSVATGRHRLRLVQRDAERAQAAVDNLRVCLLKLEVRARKIGDGPDPMVDAYDTRASECSRDLHEAARLLGVALGELDKVTDRMRR